MGCFASSDRREELEPPPVVEEQKVEVDLFDRDSLVRWIEWADIALIDTNWLRATCFRSREVLLNRRQELPPEAFVPTCELRNRHIVSLSYGWADPANPDPNGAYAKMLQSYFGLEKDKWPEGAALFWDHKSLYQHRIRPEWDGRRETFAQNLIQGRTPGEDVKFRRAMAGMQALYFHAHTFALIAEYVPTDGRNPRGYEYRGWTAMECAGAYLSGRVGAVILAGFANSIPQKALVPMSVEDFAFEVSLRFFFRDEDRPEVVRMYRDGFTAYAQKLEELEVYLNNGEKKNWLRLAGALPQFQRLREVRLEGYPHGPDGFQGRRRSLQLDEALDALSRRGCRILTRADSGATEKADMRPWDPDSGERLSDGFKNPAHSPPRGTCFD